MAKRNSTKREAKREELLGGGNNRRSAKAALGANVGRSSAADQPPRSKTKAASRRPGRG
jgi:hypothetical protein